MTVDLKPKQQCVIDLALRSGAFQDPDEVLDQAFDIIREQFDLEDWMFERRESIAAHIEKGFAQAERGETMGGDTVVECCGNDVLSGRSRRNEYAFSRTHPCQRWTMFVIPGKVVASTFPIAPARTRWRSWRSD
jgi:hypothetical protein